MSLVVQGPETGLLSLEEQLGTHWMVKSLEAGPYDPSATTPLTPPTPVANATLVHASAPSTPAQAGTVAGNGDADRKRIEALLPQVARDYPQIFGAVMGLERNMEPTQREASMRYVGARVGAWVYKRDFALGARLSLSDSIKHVALPAMRQLLPTELEGDVLSTGSSPFCAAERSVTAPQCHFLRGFLEGSLNECGYLGMVRVSEIACRASGSESCKFAFHV